MQFSPFFFKEMDEVKVQYLTLVFKLHNKLLRWKASFAVLTALYYQSEWFFAWLLVPFFGLFYWGQLELLYLVIYEVTVKILKLSFGSQVFHCNQRFVLLCWDDSEHKFHGLLSMVLTFQWVCVTWSSVGHSILPATPVYDGTDLFTDVQ